jgi:hypothetical protein
MTDKQNTTLNMSLVPLFLLIALILGAGYFLVQGEIKLPKFNRGPQIRRLEGFPTIVYTDRQLEKQREIIKSEEELNEFLNYVDESGLVTVKEKIDFDKEYVLGVSTETEKETGHRIKVRKVYEDKEDNTLLVHLEEIEAGDGCEIENDPNTAVDIVAISRTDRQIDFDRIKKVKNCD